MSLMQSGQAKQWLPAETIEADLHGKNLQHADLRNMDFYEANFYGAEMQSARLDKSDLSYALLVHANLQNASLKGAKLTLADLRNAKLDGADLTGAEFFPDIDHLTETSLRLHLNHYRYQYALDDNYAVLRDAILADLLSKAKEMLDKGYRDKALGCLFAAKEHPFFSRAQINKGFLFSGNGSCQEIETYMQPILAAVPDPHKPV